MERAIFVTVLGVIFFSLCVCDSVTDKRLADAANCFTLNFYKRLAGGQKNLVSSPFSADVLLSMLLVGAGGRTAQQLSTALGYNGMSLQDMEKAFRSQLSKMTSTNGNTLDLASSVWIQQGFNVKQNFKDAVINYFRSSEHEVNFQTNSHEATEEVNNWGNKNTQGLIKKIFDKDLDPTTVLVLVNAIYFNGTWQSQFTTSDTQDGQFMNNDNKNSLSTVKFMHQQGPFYYKMDDALNAQVLEMQYVGGDMSMIVFLPGSNSNVQKLEDSLTCDTFNRGLVSLMPTVVDITYPRYEITSDFNLIDPIKSVGIVDVFEDYANFSGISPNIKVSRAIQKCVVKVNEAGSEAAVVTAIAMEAADSIDSQPVEVVPFAANHPFMFLILDKRTNIVLFIGRVNELPSL